MRSWWARGMWVTWATRSSTARTTASCSDSKNMPAAAVRTQAWLRAPCAPAAVPRHAGTVRSQPCARTCRGTRAVPGGGIITGPAVLRMDIGGALLLGRPGSLQPLRFPGSHLQRSCPCWGQRAPWSCRGRSYSPAAAAPVAGEQQNATRDLRLGLDLLQLSLFIR